MKLDSRILVLGFKGLVGSSIVRELKSVGYNNLYLPTHNELDLLDGWAVANYFNKHKPEYVFMCAAKVGGIIANNTYRADFIWENLQIQNTTFYSAYKNNVTRFLFMGSSCIYPKFSPQPIREEYLLTSELEKTNEPYAIAKIAGLKLAESFKRQYGCDFFSVMPTNLYGINDDFHLENSHVVPGIIARMYKTMQEGKTSFTVWGTGKPKREFLYVDDLARACVHLMNLDVIDFDYINIGTGKDIEIIEVAKMIAQELGFTGEILTDPSKPDGTPQKVLDVSKIMNKGWKPEISLREGLKKSILFYREKIIYDNIHPSK